MFYFFKIHKYFARLMIYKKIKLYLHGQLKLYWTSTNQYYFGAMNVTVQLQYQMYSKSNCIGSSNWMIVNNELERMEKEAAVA
jgi:hypothetical protein